MLTLQLPNSMSSIPNWLLGHPVSVLGQRIIGTFVLKTHDHSFQRVTSQCFPTDSTPMGWWLKLFHRDAFRSNFKESCYQFITTMNSSLTIAELIEELRTVLWQTLSLKQINGSWSIHKWCHYIEVQFPNWVHTSPEMV